MIVFYNPKATKPRNRRLPLSILAIAAVLEGKEEYAIVDGNIDPHPTESLIALIAERPVAVGRYSHARTATVGAVASCREVPASADRLGSFHELHGCDTQSGLCGLCGEQTFLDLWKALREPPHLKTINGLSYKDADGTPRPPAMPR